MKMSEINEMTEVELVAKSRDLRQELFRLRLQKVAANLERPSDIRAKRRDIARCETQLSILRNKNEDAAGNDS